MNPQIGIWNTIYHEGTGEGILLFILQGWWSNSALYGLEDALDLLLPDRYTRTALRPGVMRICVHLCLTPTDPRIFKISHPEQFDVDDILPTMKRVYAALARMTAAHREIAVDPPNPANALLKPSRNAVEAFQEAVRSLGAKEYPEHVEDYPSERRFGRDSDKGDRWVKLYHSPHSGLLGSRKLTDQFRFGDVVTSDELVTFIKSCESN